jgi:hypothetical protein
MDNHSTDTQFGRVKAESIDYWLLIDGIDAELSGTPLKYHSSEQVSAATGVSRKWVDVILYRKRLALLKIDTIHAMLK